MNESGDKKRGQSASRQHQHLFNVQYIFLQDRNVLGPVWSHMQGSAWASSRTHHFFTLSIYYYFYYLWVGGGFTEPPKFIDCFSSVL